MFKNYFTYIVLAAHNMQKIARTLTMRSFTLFVLFLVPLTVYASEVPNFKRIDLSKDVVFFLSTSKSGANLITSSLSAITRKPISWLGWGNKIFDPSSEHRQNPSYNRLGLSLVSDKPLLYRTHHAFSKLKQVPSRLNKLIFVTRNPKELLFRRFFLQSSSLQDPDPQFIETFLSRYLEAFKMYEAWFPKNRLIVFYEDFINEGDELLLKLLEFMGESPTYLNDFKINKQEYLSRLLESYLKQHKANSGGASSLGEPKAIYYTKHARLETLQYIDKYLQKKEPVIWGKYLKRFQSSTEE